MASRNLTQDILGSSGMVSGQLPFRCLVGDEKCPECSDRDNDDCDGGFRLDPKYRPCGIDLAMADVSSSDFDYRRDCRENAEAQDPPKCQFSAEVYSDVPE